MKSWASTHILILKNKIMYVSHVLKDREIITNKIFNKVVQYSSSYSMTSFTCERVLTVP